MVLHSNNNQYLFTINQNIIIYGGHVTIAPLHAIVYVIVINYTFVQTARATCRLHPEFLVTKLFTEAEHLRLQDRSTTMRFTIQTNT